MNIKMDNNVKKKLTPESPSKIHGVIPYKGWIWLIAGANRLSLNFLRLSANTEMDPNHSTLDYHTAIFMAAMATLTNWTMVAKAIKAFPTVHQHC